MSASYLGPFRLVGEKDDLIKALAMMCDDMLETTQQDLDRSVKMQDKKKSGKPGKKPAKGTKKDVAFYPKVKSTKKSGLGKYA